MSIKLLIVLFLLSCTAILGAQNHTTYPYHDGLELDLYPSKTPSKSLMIYVHGGGFSGGTRDEGKDYCHYLQEQGIDCASITYTLYMKGRSQDWGCDGIHLEKMKTLQLAASEIWAATAYLIGEDSPMAQVPENVYLAGASAGAEAVLAAGFYDRAKYDLVDHGLGADFRYAGILSGAGAMVDENLISEANNTPLALFHGTNDPLVPYGTAAHHFCSPDQSGYLMLFGAGALADRMDEVGGSYVLYQHPGAGHEIAGRYFHADFAETLRFVELTRGGGSFRLRYSVGMR